MLDMEAKLKTIKALQPDELIGYWQALGKYRQPFEGEAAAVMERARVLRVDLSKTPKE